MLSSILKLVFLSQLIILSLEAVTSFTNCKIYPNEVKNKTRTTYIPDKNTNTIVFYADVSSWTNEKDLHFYIEMSETDILDESEREVFRTYVSFSDEKPTNEENKCNIEENNIVDYKKRVNGTNDEYKKYRYKVTKQNKKYLPVAVDSDFTFEKKVYFYLWDESLYFYLGKDEVSDESKETNKTVIIIIIVIVVILVIAGIVVLVLFIKKKNKQKQKTQNQQQMYNQNQMYNQQQGQTQVLYNEYGQQYVNNVQVNNQGIAPTDNQGNAQYGQYGQTAPYSSQGYVSGQ